MGLTTVYLVGATGFTGSIIVDALLQRGDEFRVIAAIRLESVEKPAVEELRARGVEIRVLDIESADHAQLVAELRGVDTVVSTIFPLPHLLQAQKPLARAAKEAGVTRFVPSNWATACPRGVMKLHDLKGDIQDYIKEIDLGYTFIDVGWWSQNLACAVNPAKADYPETVSFNLTLYSPSVGEAGVRTAITDKRDIGAYVARILLDSRTLNQYVFIWGEETTQREAFSLAERISGRKIEFPHLDAKELEAQMTSTEGIRPFLAQYMASLWLRGDNTVENAKKEEYGGALDAKELYPDYTPRTLEHLMKEWCA